MESKNTLWTTASFISRHLIAVIISVVLPVIVVIVGYFVLLLIAIITNGGPGGPLALPFGILLAFVLSLFYSVSLLFPATALAEIATRSFNKWKHLVQIPLSFIILALLIGLMAAVIEYLAYGRLALAQWALTSGIVIALLAIPLGFYWWATKFSQLLIEGLRTAFNKLREILFRS